MQAVRYKMGQRKGKVQAVKTYKMGQRKGKVQAVKTNKRGRGRPTGPRE